MAVCYAVNSTILKESNKGNCIFSPDSSVTLFSLLYDAYDGETQASINHAFNWRDLEAQETCKSDNLYEGKLKNASKLFYRTEGHLQKEMRDKLKNKCDIEVIDVKSATSLNSILNWSKENIKDPTFNLFQSPSLNNLINFNFQWAKHFQKNDTTKEKFFKSNIDIIETEFMTQKSNFGYKEDEELNAHILEIPYSNENVSMFLFIPKHEKDLSQLENKLTTLYAFEELSHIQKHSITLSIPKFKFNKMLNMKSILQKTHQNNPPYKLSTFLPSHMGEMLTKASIEVDEHGSKATAASAYELILDPQVKEMTFETTIANRFAKTLVTHNMENLENISQEATFSMILPEDAFISEFIMVIKGKSYMSYVREKEKAKHIYDEAVTSGRGAAHVAVSARDSNKFTVSVNIEPLSKATFLLTYEELLQRKFNQYELVLNIQPGYLVDIIKVLVKINECRKLRYVKTPAIRSGNELINNSDTNPLTEIEISDSTATIKFEPDIEYQKQIACKFEKTEHSGFCGQFIVQYDVELDPSNGEIFVSDGYFVHFYAPDDLPPLSKHVVFTLDTSASMHGRKIEQVQEAMQCILDQIRKHDLVDILEFTNNVTVHDIESETSTVISYEEEENYYEPFYKYERISLPGAKPANKNIIKSAKNVVKRMRATNSTHIIGGLETALYLVKICQEKFSDHQPIIVFLTDGEPNKGIQDTNEITRVVTKLNQENNKAPIFSLSFGEGADKYFLRKLSLSNFGFSRHIYEASDASLQLQQFYKQISSPLLSNVAFNYDSNVEDATRNYFPIYFQGSDIVLCGRYTDSIGPNCVNLIRPGGHVILSPIINQTTTPIERVWAYLTIKQMLENRENTDNKAEFTKKAVELALKYSFVTEVTSLVVVKPDGEESSTVNTESAFEAGSNDFVPGESFMTAVSRRSAVPLCALTTQINCSAQRSSFWSFSSAMERSITVSRGPMRSMARCSSKEHSWEADDISFSKKIKNKIVKLMKVEKKISVPTEFMVNRPFLIIIQAKINKRNVILFMGRVLEPVCEKCSN